MAVDLAAFYGTTPYFKVTFFLDHNLWSGIPATATLNWDWHEFTPASTPNIPTTAGVYAFCVEMRVAGNLTGRYVMYVGKSERSRGLRRRFGEYLSEATTATPRDLLGHMFRMWPQHLVFACAETGALEPRVVEDQLLAALLPPMNTQLPAHIRPAVAAFR